MKLYLLRHGDYAMSGPKQLDSLTREGKAEIQQLSCVLHTLDLSITALFHSGRNRALETATIIANVLAITNVSTLKGIDPLDNVKTFAHDLYYEDNDLFIVSHLPFLSRLVSELIIKKDHPDIVDFATGTCICLERLDHSQFIVKWILSKELYANFPIKPDVIN